MLVLVGALGDVGVCLAAGIHGLVLVLLGFLLANVNMRGLSLEVSMPERAEALVPFPVSISVCNATRVLPCMFIAMRDQTRPSMVCGMPHVCCIAPRGSVVLSGDGSVSKRGIYGHMDLELTSSFPLGLVHAQQLMRAPVCLTVVPQPLATQLSVDSRPCDDVGHGREHRENSSMEGLFRSLREYRPGLATQLIDWKTSSRRTVPVVRELEHPWPRRARVLFHSYRPSGAVVHSRLFERGLERLAGTLIAVGEQRWHSELWMDFDPADAPVVINAGDDRGVDAALAAAEPPRTHGFGEVLQLLGDRRAGEWLHIVVSGCPRRYWEHAAEAACKGPLICLDGRGGRA
jgi:uncharacterized protein (DUF58 family)